MSTSRIALLVIKGATNQEIEKELELTHRTVENHLFAIHSKLGISSKVELVRMASELEIL